MNNWKKQRQQEYYDIKQEVHELIKLCGSNCSDLKMTMTYVAIADTDDITKIHNYFIFLPFVTGNEKLWKEQNSKPWEQSYEFCEYNSNNTYFYIKDDAMNVPQNFYKVVHTTLRDVYIIEYTNYCLKLPEIIYVSYKPPILHSIEYDNTTITYSSFDNWYNNKVSTTKKAVITFSSPLKNIMPFPTCDIQLSLGNNRTFFKVSRTSLL